MYVFKDHHPQKIVGSITNVDDLKKAELVKRIAKEHNCVILLKGPLDIISDGKRIAFNALYVFIQVNFKCNGFIPRICL